MFFKPWVYVIALVIIIALIAVIQPDSNEEQLPIIGKIPAFDLVDQNSKPVSYTHLTLPTICSV